MRRNYLTFTIKNSLRKWKKWELMQKKLKFVKKTVGKIKAIYVKNDSSLETTWWKQ